MLNVELWGLRRKCPCCFAERDNSTFNIQHLTLFSLSLDISDNIALAHLAALLGIDFYELAAQCCRDGFKLAPRSLDIAEGITFLVLLTDEWLYSWLALALALELPENLTGYWCYDSISLGMLELCELSWSQGAAKLGILCLLEVSQEVLLSLTALEVAQSVKNVA